MPTLDLPPEGSLQWAEELYGNGMADRVSGNVEAPTGHFYLVDRWIVTTNFQGFSEIEEFPNEQEAEEAFNKLDNEYSEWDAE